VLGCFFVFVLFVGVCGVGLVVTVWSFVGLWLFFCGFWGCWGASVGFCFLGQELNGETVWGVASNPPYLLNLALRPHFSKPSKNQEDDFAGLSTHARFV